MLTVHSPRNYWASIPADPSNDSERWRVRELIAYLIEFHRREHRPMWWNLFNRLEMTEEELRQFVGQRLAAYKVPEAIHFVADLPLGPTGKVQRKTLREWGAGSGAPAHEARTAS